MTCANRLKALLAGAAVTLCAGAALAQPANDNCGSAQVITGDTFFDTTAATTDGSASCGFGGDPGSSDVWMMFTPTQDGTHVFAACDATFDTILSVYDSCGGFELACNDDSCGLQSRVSVQLTTGVPVWIRIAGFDIDTGTGTLTVQVGSAGNDDCSGAVEVTDGSYPFDTTTATNDTAGTCGASATSPDIWFSYLPTMTGNVLLNTCGSGYDTVLSAYDSCGGFALACNDDSCGLQSQIIVPVTQDVRIWIRVSGFANAVGTGTLLVQFLVPPANDNCADAIVVSDGSTPFNNTGATTDGFASCGFGGSQGNSDIWYRYTATATGLLTATTCPGFDTMLSIYDSCGGAELACNDDTSTGLCSRALLAVTQGTEYWIRVASWGAATGAANLTISVGDIPPGCLTQPMGSILEDEDCGLDNNGGCNNAGNLVQTIPSNAVVYGTAWADNGTRDTDWYEITLTERSLVTVRLESEFVGRTFILSGTCPAAQFGTTLNTACGAPSILSATLNPGTYRIFAGHNVFADTPCALFGNTHYILTVTSEVVGACCTSTGCVIATASGCAGLGGSFEGGGTTCGGQTFNTAENTESFLDISSSGTLANVQCDDCTANNPIGFTFRYGATDYTTVNVSSNGNIQFPPSNSAVFGNVPIPGAALPNNMIAPAWDDFNPGAGGTVYRETRGDAPNRMFIVSWQDVPQFATADANSFQVILHETTNRIEFRYGTMTFQAAGDITVGVENIDGTDGLNLDATTVIADGNRAITINSTVIPNPCGSTGACCFSNGDCSILTQGACGSAGGSWQGADTNCGVISYTSEASGEELEDISGTGTVSAASACDDCGEVVNIGFNFSFFGNNFTQVAVTSNGYLAFGAGNVLGDFSNDCPIPNAFTPNNIICPAWDDFNPGSRATAFVYYQTLGDAPNRRFVVLWKDVPQFANTDFNTFQAILYEGSNDIEFRYGDMTFQVACDITVGVENADGSAGLNLSAIDVIGSGRTAVRLSDVATGGCPGGDPCDVADFNADGNIDADDLGDFINCYFGQQSAPGSCPDADFNNDGNFDADDLGDFINTYFGCV